jgi:hypothetical protein
MREIRKDKRNSQESIKRVSKNTKIILTQYQEKNT